MSPQLWPAPPLRLDFDTAVTVTTSGTAIAFLAGMFSQRPSVTASITSAAGNLQGAMLRISTISPTGCTIYLTAPGGASSAPVDWQAIGV